MIDTVESEQGLAAGQAAAVRNGAPAAGTDAGGAAVPGPAAAAAVARLGVMVGGQRMLVSLADAGEIVPVPGAIMPIPLSRAWVLGLMNLRGSLYVVNDLGRFMGGAPADIGRESRLLALGPGLDFNAALVVDRMLGLHAIAAMREELPEAGTGQPATGPQADRAWLGRRLVDAEGKRWRELLLHELVRDADFLLIGR